MCILAPSNWFSQYDPVPYKLMGDQSFGLNKSATQSGALSALGGDFHPVMSANRMDTALIKIDWCSQLLISHPQLSQGYSFMVKRRGS